MPVALFAFRRVDLLARTLAALRANAVPLVYAFSEGARDSADEADVAAVRTVLREVDWTEMRVVERPSNLGLDRSILGGISEVLVAHDEIVICEDDIEMAPGSYEYFLAALDHYRDEPRVMCINGWTHPNVTPADARDAPHFTGRFGGWGWATWRRAWTGFPEMTPLELRDQCASRGIDIAKYGDDVVHAFEGNPSTASWDFRFNLFMMLRDGLTLMPARTMTAHIGYDPRASHPQDGVGWEDHPEPPPPPSMVAWPEVRENLLAVECWRRAMNAPAPPSLVTRIRRRLVSMLRVRGPAK